MATVWASSEDKVCLMLKLKKVRTANCAMQFCSVLFKAKKMLQKCENKEVDMSSTQKLFLQDINKILNCVPADELVQRIFKVLRAHHKNLCLKERQHLILLLKSECVVDPAKYLTQLIGTVESVVKNIFADDCFKNYYLILYKCRNYENLVELKELEELLELYGREKAGDFLHILFYIRLNESFLSCEEKEEIRDLVIDAIPHCGTFLTNYIYYKYTSGIDLLQLRSAMQFFTDMLADYSGEHKTLKELVANLENSMKILDHRVAWSKPNGMTASENYYSELSDFIIDEHTQTLEVFYKAGANFVPKGHIWWQQFKEGNF